MKRNVVHFVEERSDLFVSHQPRDRRRLGRFISARMDGVGLIVLPIPLLTCGTAPPPTKRNPAWFLVGPPGLEHPC
jgi:hypothetical protein